ncbi:MAG TPA: cobalamin B12-binding domain-containing protein [Acidimicrobiales bacterium]|nr:cobalamin B12-binding domain-containing protein [Acidimicrobiales bacterium]
MTSHGDPDEPPGPSAGLTLQEAAARLGVHYMTAYRYVRIGRLRARRRGGRWEVTEADLDAFERRGPPGRRGSVSWLDDAPAAGATPAGGAVAALQRGRLLDRLLAGDEPGAWRVVESTLVSQTTAERAHLDLLAPCLVEVGRRWAHGALTVGGEHVASTTAARLAARLAPLSAGPGRRRGTVVLGGAPGEQHGLPLTLLTNVLRARGWRVVELGPDTPVDDLLWAARDADQLIAVGVCAGSDGTLPAAAEVLAALRRALPAVPLLAGGPAVPDDRSARALGADSGGVEADHVATLLTDLPSPSH